MTDSSISKIENGRASFAFECANKIKDKNLKKAYKSHVKSFPMLIKTNGLGSALAFLFTKQDTAYKLMGDHIVKWVKNSNNLGFENYNDLKSLIKEIVNLNSSEYRVLTVEVLSLFKWLRRFAEGLCED